jgi:ketosteroid isomerase-like protein
MSQDNVEILRRHDEHFRRTGKPQWETIGPEIEIHDHDIPDAGIYRGHAGWREWLAHFGEAWESFTVEMEEYVDAGDDKVVTLVRLSARGKGSGVEVDRRDGIVWTLSDGKVVRLDYYGSRAAALEAVGLKE